MASYRPGVTRLAWPNGPMAVGRAERRPTATRDSVHADGRSANGPGSVLKYSFGLFIKSGLTEHYSCLKWIAESTLARCFFGLYRGSNDPADLTIRSKRE